ncbi:MAG: hypothetical protein U0768_08370 [Anaerolineae bacterium]
MPWTPTQIHALVMSYAHEGEALCPTCHVPMLARQIPLPRDTRPVTTLSCPVCWTETRLVVPSMDPSAATVL